MTLPGVVKVYKPLRGKYHLQPVCAGGRADAREITEKEFLRHLREGEVCRMCIGDTKSMIMITETDIVLKYVARWAKDHDREKCPNCGSDVEPACTITLRRSALSCPVCGNLIEVPFPEEELS